MLVGSPMVVLSFIDAQNVDQGLFVLNILTNLKQKMEKPHKHRLPPKQKIKIEEE